jgi:hypothetical protein
MSQVDIAKERESYKDCAALVGLISRMNLASEQENADDENGPVDLEYLSSNHEALEALIIRARELCGK